MSIYTMSTNKIRPVKRPDESNSFKEILQRLQRRYRYTIWIFIAAVLLLYPYWSNTDYPFGHDTSYHISSIVGLAQGSWWDLFSPSIIGFIGNDLGYGSGLFYPQLAHIISTVLLKLGAPFGMSVFVAVRLTDFLILFLSGLLIYKLMLLLRNNQKAGLVAAILYMGATYHLSDILIRDAQAESLLFLFLPLVGIALYYLSRQRLRLFLLLFVISGVGLMSSHLVLTMYTAFVALIFMIWHRRHFFTKQRLLYLVIGGILSLLLISPFLVALWQNSTYTDVRAFTDQFMLWPSFDLVMPYSFFNLEYTYDSIVWALNLPAVIFLIYMLATQKCVRQDRLLQSLIGMSVILIVVMVAVPFTKLPYVFQMIQFPWRLNLFLCFTLALSCALCFTYVQKLDWQRLWFGLFILGCFIGASTVWSHVPHYNEEYTLEDARIRTLAFDDYLPVNSYNNKEYVSARNSDEVLAGKASTVISDFENDFPGLSFSVTLGNSADATTTDVASIEVVDVADTSTTELVGDTLELPRFYYLGYQIIATYADGTTEELSYYENEYGLIEIYVTSDATITVTYTGTHLQYVARVVATITAAACVAYMVVVTFSTTSTAQSKHTKRQNTHRRQSQNIRRQQDTRRIT